MKDGFCQAIQNQLCNYWLTLSSWRWNRFKCRNPSFIFQYVHLEILFIASQCVYIEAGSKQHSEFSNSFWLRLWSHFALCSILPGNSGKLRGIYMILQVLSCKLPVAPALFPKRSFISWHKSLDGPCHGILQRQGAQIRLAHCHFFHILQNKIQYPACQIQHV